MKLSTRSSRRHHRLEQTELWINSLRDFTGGSDGKVCAYNAGDLCSIPGSGRSPGEGNGNPLLYSCLENPMDGGAWWAIEHGVAKSRTQLSNFSFFFFKPWITIKSGNTFFLMGDERRDSPRWLHTYYSRSIWVCSRLLNGAPEEEDSATDPPTPVWQGKTDPDFISEPRVCCQKARALGRSCCSRCICYRGIRDNCWRPSAYWTPGSKVVRGRLRDLMKDQWRSPKVKSSIRTDSRGVSWLPDFSFTSMRVKSFIETGSRTQPIHSNSKKRHLL